MAEGVFFSMDLEGYQISDAGDCYHASDPRWSFIQLWVQIHGPKSWDDNPWVWVVEFERVRKQSVHRLHKVGK